MSDYDDEADMGDDFDDGGFDMSGPPSLPEGITKTVITEAPEDNFARPKSGDEVHVHYTGWLEDGEKFDSSRDRPGDFSFALGKGSVIRGWDLGVATMKKGEKAEFLLAPEYAYGASGSPPKIPASATLKFEVELLSWKSKDDLTDDGGVVKTVEKEGEGWKKPSKDGACLLRFAGKLEDGTEFVSSPEGGVEIDLSASETATGLPLSTLQLVLPSMKKGERSAVKLSAAYAFGSDGGFKGKVPKDTGVEFELELLEIFKVDDCGLYSDKRQGDFATFPAIMKKEVKEGEGYDKPGFFSKVKVSIRVESGGVELVKEREEEWALSTGVHCEALEEAVKKMAKSSQAVVSVEDASICQDPALGLKPTGPVKLYLTLLETEKASETWNMSNAEKVAHGEKLKAQGTAYIKAQEFRRSCALYKACADVFSYMDKWEDAEKDAGTTLKKQCKGNEAQGWLKLQQWREVEKLCNEVLKDESCNAKALFRRGQAHLGLKDAEMAQRDFEKVLEQDPANADAKKQLARAKAVLKRDEKRQAGLFKNMMGCVGKMNYPAKGPQEDAEKDFGGDDMDEDEDDMPPLEETPAAA